MGSALFEDTIAAIGTAPGRGAIALLRVSGRESLAIVRAVCPTLPETIPPRTAHLRAIRHPETGELLDRALVTFFPGPRSYTGDDLVEITSHGGMLTPQLVLDALLAAGARLAEPGEFTRRAVYHGRLDILQAEAVADLIDGRSVALHRAAIHQMEGGLSRTIAELRAAILRIEALVAYGIDFPEEDEPPVPPEAVHAATDEVVSRIDRLLATADQGEMLREGALVVLAGRPNSGKSSLFNALLGMERALVTEVPGTTRDAVEAALSLEGYPFRLVDTAGLRTTDDLVEGLGIEVARKYVQASDIILFCADACAPLGPEEQEFLSDVDSRRTVVVRTKTDLGDSVASPDSAPHGMREVRVSSTERSGFEELRDALLELAFGAIVGAPGEQPIVVRARNARSLRKAREEVALFDSTFRTGTPPEFASTHLRAAAHALTDLIGAVTPDDVLGEIFGSFCVGK